MSYAVRSRKTENILNVPDILRRDATLVSVYTILPCTHQYNMLEGTGDLLVDIRGA